MLDTRKILLFFTTCYKSAITGGLSNQNPLTANTEEKQPQTQKWKVYRVQSNNASCTQLNWFGSVCSDKPGWETFRVVRRDLYASRDAINAPIGLVSEICLLKRQGSGEIHSEDTLNFLMSKYKYFYFQFQAIAQEDTFLVHNHLEHMPEVSIEPELKKKV